MKLLALESSTDACSVALRMNDELVTDHRIAPRKHAQLLLPMIETLLVDAGIKITDLDGIAFGRGPGSFTGVRIAAAATQGLAFGADVGVIPVSSLNALAQGAVRIHAATHVFASFDARMGEVYWGAYATDAESIMQPLFNDCVCAPELVPVVANAETHSWRLLGSGADEYASVLQAALPDSVEVELTEQCWPDAQDVLQVAMPIAAAGHFQSAADALPVYLRDKVALTEAERASGERL